MCGSPSLSTNNNHVAIDISEKGEEQSSTLPSLRDVPLVELTLDHISYAPTTRSSTANSKLNKKRTMVLQDVSTSIKPYELNAWMGKLLV